MIVLTIRTDKPEAEIGMYDGTTRLVYKTWLAHRQLAETIHKTIQEVFTKANTDWSAVQGIVCFQGPGSFTGLRIGLTVANALAYSYGVPIVAEQGDSWIETGINRLLAGQNDEQAVPFYGAEAHITSPKK